MVYMIRSRWDCMMIIYDIYIILQKIPLLWFNALATSCNQYEIDVIIITQYLNEDTSIYRHTHNVTNIHTDVKCRGNVFVCSNVWHFVLVDFEEQVCS